jgi:hypothetical protein
MELNGQLHAPAALLPGKEPPVPIGWETGRASEPVWTRWWRKTFAAPAGTQTPILQPVIQRYITELFRLPNLAEEGIILEVFLFRF